jgi:hypothetical protein
MKADIKTHPFKTPEGYFSDLENAILLRTTGEKTESHPFKAPDPYFEQLENSIILQTVNKQEVNKGKIIPLFSKKFYWTSAAACVVFIIMTGVYFFNNNVSVNTTAIAENEATKAISVIDEVYDSNTDVEITVLDTGAYVSRAVQPSDTKENSKYQPVSQKEIKNKPVEKSSDVLFSLYFEEEADATEEDIFFL